MGFYTIRIPLRVHFTGSTWVYGLGSTGRIMGLGKCGYTYRTLELSVIISIVTVLNPSIVAAQLQVNIVFDHETSTPSARGTR